MGIRTAGQGGGPASLPGNLGQLRTKERDNHHESGIQQMGWNLLRRADDGGDNRPPGAPQLPAAFRWPEQPGERLFDAQGGVKNSSPPGGEKSLQLRGFPSCKIQAQEFLDKEERNINVIVEKLRAAVDEKRPDTISAPLVSQLIQVVKNWDFVAQPIQVSAKSRGLDHEASHRVARLVRELAVYIFNEHGKLDFSQQLTSMLQEVFAEVGDVAERTSEDGKTLNNIAEQRARLMEEAKDREEKWREEITYVAEIGALFEDKLCISPEGIYWKGHHWNLDSITGVRWGGTRNYANGISTGTVYSIFISDGDFSDFIDTRKEGIFLNFIDRLWKSVGVRLLTEYLEGLRNGKTYRFGSAILSDHGMELERKRLFSSNEKCFCTWSELEISNGPGVFCISKKKDRKFTVSLSYLNEDNIHILEAAITLSRKQGGVMLSNILGD